MTKPGRKGGALLGKKRRRSNNFLNKNLKVTKKIHERLVPIIGTSLA